ncbi:Uncharacterised protein [Mycobacteroides abscessus subsp. abscessus]|nr:Uncharacterised protein [Mycobacteroides abscessus subsp. abscessus]
MSISSARPTTAPHGRPPPITLPRQVRSATRKPLTTSSKISGMSSSVHSPRSAVRNSTFSATTEVGIGSRITQASSSACSRILASPSRSPYCITTVLATVAGSTPCEPATGSGRCRSPEKRNQELTMP